MPVSLTHKTKQIIYTEFQGATCPGLTLLASYMTHAVAYYSITFEIKASTHMMLDLKVK